jgi:(S)-sulfolactate dehydrogenase
MPTIVISEFMDEAAIRDVLARFDVHYDPALAERPQKLQALLADARALIVRNRTQVRGPVLAAAAKLEVIGRLGVGLDNIDVETCKARGIAVYPAVGANESSVAEYVIAAILMLLRGAYFATGEMIAGQWPRNRLIGREAAGKTLGLVGYGANARATAARALALGMDVVAHDPQVPESDAAWRQASGTVARSDLDSLLANADVVSLHVPLTLQTRNLIDAAVIGRIKRGAILINAARGGIVDEATLVAALKSGQLGGAALDVFAEEPLSAGHGVLLSGCPNLILTPHIAGVTEESNVRISRVTAENVRRHLMRG